MQPKFPLGQVVATPGVLAALQEAGHAPLEFIGRHVAGDWGELDEEDRRENELSVREGFWIITEADRSATTILLPEEY
jgi:hypothetical protein